MNVVNVYSSSLKSKIPSIVLGIFAFLLLVITQNSSMIPVKSSQAKFISPPPLLERFTFGYSEVMADTFWIRVVQDMDYCDEVTGKIGEVSVCANDSWLYKMIDTITNLSPNFRTPYAVGSLALTILITDVDGATKIFEKAIKAFPTDWPILYRAAYHYMYEVKDNKRAAELLMKAADYGAPPWTRTLAGRLLADSGNIDLAEQVLRSMKESNQDPLLIERLSNKIQQIKINKNEK
ncbi:tetratricopeptide repeat protein [Bdellovibrio sp. HCB274]|uniref:tetratricopeptide repeat protein n=1 Tax=Bdellovibrio sp. HCB274 TaxID=3394361 RepID=UPI0039B41DE1